MMTVELLALSRWAVPGALLMGSAWFTAGVIAFALAGGGYGDVPSRSWYLIELTHAIGWIGALPALVGMHVLQAARTGRLGRFGFWAAFTGTAVMAVAYVPAILYPMNAAAGTLFLAGLLIQGVGFPLLGAATLRGGVLPGWFGWLLIAFLPLAGTLHLVLLAPGPGGIAVGVLWLLLAHQLWSKQRSAIHQRAPAR
jgi:hypothetical protein